MGLGVGPGAEVSGLTLCSRPMTSVEELPVPLRLEWSWCPKVAQRPLSLRARQKLGWRATPTPREPPGALHRPHWRHEAAQEAGAEPQGVPGHQSSSEKPRTICQAPQAGEDHPGIYSGCCGAHPRGSLWEDVQLNDNLPFRGFV